ncbi:BSD domain containing protein, partial [Cryptosporidium parvum]
MGIVESVEDLTQEMELEMKDFDETMQDNVFPWFHIVQWSSEELPTNTVLKWNYKSIKEKVQSLTLNKQVFLTNCPVSRIQGFSLDEDDPDCIIPFAEWAAALLSQMDELNNIRYELVPSRMSESIFWQSYFNAIRNIIIKDVIISTENGNSLLSNSSFPVKKY